MYHQTVTLPRGSGQVKISELLPTHNLYLAATTPTENFNGNYKVKEGGRGSYWFAGAKWWYERPEGGIEVLRTTGVVKDDVTIFVITNSRNLSIQYSAGVPLGNASIFEVSYVWRVGDWGRCEGVCGEGVKRRSGDCVVSGTEIVVRDDLCDPSAKPVEEEACYSDIGCEYNWRVSPWTDCNATCGAGVKTRVFHCQVASNQSVVADRHCENESAPVDRLDCYSERGCEYQWQLGAWSNCSSQCGYGERQRLVTCVVTSNGSFVPPSLCEVNSSRPANHDSCYSETGCTLEWVSGNWSECSAECGSGTRHRDISCVLMENGTRVVESRCGSESRPAAESACYSERGCVFEWSLTGWSQCDSACGWGQREREATCLLTNNQTVVDRNHCQQPEPETSSQCHSEDGCTYLWQYGNWTSCSTDCGIGTSSRDISCLLTNNNTLVDLSHCPTDSRPVETASCRDNSGCVFVWASEPWSECSSSCGEGRSTRHISCLLLNNQTTVEDELCLSVSLRPAAEQSCYSETGCEFVWQAGDWGACSAVCGGGEREREISCVLTNNGSSVDDSFCEDSSPRPATVSVCSEDDCRYEWTVGDWGVCEGDNSDSCEGGRKQRPVQCILVNNQSAVENAELCAGDQRPSDSTSCWIEGCQYVWVLGRWGSCSSVCGEGERERDVHCGAQFGEGVTGVRVEEEMCGSELPSRRESCSAEPCSNFVWDKGEWSKVHKLTHTAYTLCNLHSLSLSLSLSLV